MDSCPICMTALLPGQHIVSCHEATHTVHKHCHDRQRLHMAACTSSPTDPDVCVYCRDNQGIRRNRLAERFAEHLGVTATEALVTSGGLSYTGEWQNNMPHGKGVGTYLNEHLGHGPRMHKSVVGGTYDGTWKNGLRSGNGKWRAASGRSFDGEWNEDRPHGKGTMTWSSGDTYVGSFQKGKACGHGCMTRTSGAKYTGQWSNGVYEGKGTRIWPDGSCYTGEWQQGRQHGQGMMKHADGRQEQGVWKNGSLWSGKILAATHTVSHGKTTRVAHHDKASTQQTVASKPHKRHAKELLSRSTMARTSDEGALATDYSAPYISTQGSPKRQRVCAAAEM